MSKAALSISVGLVSAAAHADFAAAGSPNSTADQSQSPTSNAEQGKTTDLQEVVVTAEKREERLLDVPIPLAVVKADELVENNQVRLTDYYMQVPGLSVAPGNQSGQLLSIRGLTTGSGGTVGVTIDDVPIGAGGSGALVSDIDPSNLARIEVLRGPQGTLYGADSMGGLLRYVTADPSTSGLSGRVEAGAESVQNGAELGYDARGAINVPLGENLAMRASVFAREDPGYIDNPILGINGINKSDGSGGYLSLLWHASDSLSVKLNALFQKVDGNSTNDETSFSFINNLPMAPLQLQQGYIAGVGPYSRTFQFYSATLTDKIGNVELTSITSYHVASFTDSFDFTNAFAGLSQYIFGVPTSRFNDVSDDYTFSQEVRLTFPLGSRVDGLLGGFYTHGDSPYDQIAHAENAYTGATVGEVVNGYFPSWGSEAAVFGDLTFHITNRFDVQLGGRQSKDVGDTQSVFAGIYDTVVLGQPSPVINPVTHSASSPFTYLFTPRFMFTPDLMVYARLASGFRPGGFNSLSPEIPNQYQPDKTQTYEVGAKGDFLDHTLSVDTSVYYIDWKNIQVDYTSPSTGLTYTVNAGEAKSQGVELNVESHPLGGLRIAGWIAWNEAVVTGAPVTSSLGQDVGETLPWAPHFSGNLSVDDEFPVGTNLRGFVGAAVSYVGDRKDVFTGGNPVTGIANPRQDLPAYTRTDLHTGLIDDSWKVSLYANNVTNQRGLISGGALTGDPYALFYIQPLTVGISVTRTF